MFTVNHQTNRIDGQTNRSWFTELATALAFAVLKPHSKCSLAACQLRFFLWFCLVHSALITRFQPTTRELGFTERKHLQLFTRSGLRLAHEPSASAEELLIIQKEFDGFALLPSVLAAGGERLDLLALKNKLVEVD